MKNTLKINLADKTIVMDRTFAKLAADTRSEEYAHLQQIRRDYPTYTVVQRQIRRNNTKVTYAGLNYEYMKAYAEGLMNVSELARVCGLSRPTAYKYIKMMQ